MSIFDKIFKKGDSLVSSNEVDLKYIAKNSTDCKERMDAVQGISDQEFLYDIAVNDNDFGVAKAAVGRITRQDYLTAIGRDNAAHDWRCRRAAIERMENVSALKHIIATEAELTINLAAKERLSALKAE